MTKTDVLVCLPIDDIKAKVQNVQPSKGQTSGACPIGHVEEKMSNKLHFL